MKMSGWRSGKKI